MKGKRIFTRSEADVIITLIRKKVLADTSGQKKFRDKIRALGFYATDFGIGGGYTEHDFLKVVNIVTEGPKPVAETIRLTLESVKLSSQIKAGKRSNSDEAYIIDLCDEILKLAGNRQHRFDFLYGDSGTKLPVDTYYASLNLVVEYREKQHTEEVKFFNRRQTVSGVNRGEQRKIYDQRRRDILPKHGIKLIEFGYDEFEHNRFNQLLRNKGNDLGVIRKKMKSFIK